MKIMSWRRDYSSIMINPKFQLNFIGKLVLVCFINLFIMFAAIELSIHQFNTYFQSLGTDPNSAVFAFLKKQHAILIWTFLGASAFILVNMFVAGIILSHRVAGPLYRLTNYLKDYSAGKQVGPLKFRHKDYFLEVSDHINAALEKDRKDKNQKSA